MLYYDFNSNEVLSEEGISTKYGTHILNEHGSIKSINIISGGNGYVMENDELICKKVLIAGGNSTQNAICEATLNESGEVVNVKITSGGSGYNIGDNLSISGILTDDSQTSAALLTVTSLNTVEDQLRQSDIYPIKDEKVIPEGWKENPIISIEELINQGPLYAHDETYAWKICRIYQHESELIAYQKSHQKYFDEIEPLWKK
jgi:hypothetical protein